MGIFDTLGTDAKIGTAVLEHLPQITAQTTRVADASETFVAVMQKSVDAIEKAAPVFIAAILPELKSLPDVIKTELAEVKKLLAEIKTTLNQPSEPQPPFGWR